MLIMFLKETAQQYLQAFFCTKKKKKEFYGCYDHITNH